MVDRYCNKTMYYNELLSREVTVFVLCRRLGSTPSGHCIVRRAVVDHLIHSAQHSSIANMSNRCTSRRFSVLPSCNKRVTGAATHLAGGHWRSSLRRRWHCKHCSSGSCEAGFFLAKQMCLLAEFLAPLQCSIGLCTSLPTQPCGIRRSSRAV